MAASILKRNLFKLPAPNWWLWLCFSILLSASFLLFPYDHGIGDVYSDWSTIPNWMEFVVRNFRHFTYWFSVLCDELGWPFVHSICIPIAISWFAQFFVMFIWRASRRRSAA